MNGAISVSSRSPFSWTASEGRVSRLGYLLLCLEGQKRQESGGPAPREKAVEFGGAHCGLGHFTHSSGSDYASSPWRSELHFTLDKVETEAQGG